MAIQLAGRVLAALALVLPAAAACRSRPVDPGECLPRTVWLLRSERARLSEAGGLDTRVAPDGERVTLELPADHVPKSKDGRRWVCTGGSIWSEPTPDDAETDVTLASAEMALLEFDVAALDGLAPTPFVVRAPHSEPGVIRYALTGHWERVGDTTWWEFRRIPLAW